MAALDPDVALLVGNAIDEVRAEPGDVMRWLRLGMSYEANEQPVLAARTYRAVTELAPRDSRGWFGLAKVSAARGKIDEAERAMRRAIEFEPDYAPSHWRLGYWLFEQGEIEQAAQHFQRAVHLEESDPAPWFGMARVQLARGDVANAVTILEWLAKAPPPNGPYAWQLLAGAYRQLGRTDEAETARLRGHGAAPDFRDPWQIEVARLERGFGAQLNQAKALLAFGKADESIALLTKLHERRPDDPMVLNNLAAAYRAVGRFDESRSALDEALQLQPSFVHAHFGLALTTWTEAQSRSRPLVVDQKAADALAHLDTTLELNASYAPAYALRGDILATLEQHEEAAAAFAHAHRMQPQHASWLHQAAQQHMAIKDWSEAAALLETVTRQAPTLAEAWSDYSIALAQLGQRDEAQRALAKARELAPAAGHVAAAQQIVESAPQHKAVGP
jgi:tetratricopeptide (TPR) repeat protein